MMKICLLIAIAHDIPTKVVATKGSTRNDYHSFRIFVATDTDFVHALDQHIAKYISMKNLQFEYVLVRYKDHPENQCWWPHTIWCSNFAKTWNLSYKGCQQTQFSRRKYMAQVVPSLMMTLALRHAFDIPVGVGRIENADESMCYSYNSANKSWTI